MRQVLKEILRPFDCLIIVVAVMLFATFDYDRLETVDIIYMITFAVWFVLLLIRAAIMYNGRGGKNI